MSHTVNKTFKSDRPGSEIQGSIVTKEMVMKMIESRVIFALNTCSLSLPNEHYELWKSITMTFDVDKMLNKQ